MTDKEMNKNIDKKAVGQRIREIRIRKGLTLQQFGKYFNAEKGNVQQWEVGKQLPNKARMVKMCEIANITLNELLYGFNFNLYDEVKKLSNKEKLLLAKRLLEDVTNEE
jgi:DNA-binding helix-turn-helix protein